MALFRRTKATGPPLSRKDSLSAKPVLNRLVQMERRPDGNVILHVPRRQTALVKTVSSFFQIPAYKKVALDELSTFVIELCDGTHTVAEIVGEFSERFRLNRREAEVSMGAFLRNLAERSIIGLVIEARDD
jgi:hypothetical protein